MKNRSALPNSEDVRFTGAPYVAEMNGCIGLHGVPLLTVGCVVGTVHLTGKRSCNISQADTCSASQLGTITLFGGAVDLPIATFVAGRGVDSAGGSAFQCSTVVGQALAGDATELDAITFLGCSVNLPVSAFVTASAVEHAVALAGKNSSVESQGLAGLTIKVEPLTLLIPGYLPVTALGVLAGRCIERAVASALQRTKVEAL